MPLTGDFLPLNRQNFAPARAKMCQLRGKMQGSYLSNFTAYLLPSCTETIQRKSLHPSLFSLNRLRIRNLSGWRVVYSPSPTLHHLSPLAFFQQNKKLSARANHTDGYISWNNLNPTGWFFKGWRVVKGGWRVEDYPSPLETPINTGISGEKVKGEGYFLKSNITSSLIPFFGYFLQQPFKITKKVRTFASN